MTEENQPTDIPRFAHSVFGYDRFQVEEYLGRLREWVADMQDRANEAVRLADARDEEIRALRAQLDEQKGDDRPTAHIGATLVQTFDELHEVRRRAAEESERSLEAARREALEVVRASRELAEKLVADAEADRAAANEERNAARDEVEAARTARESAQRDVERITAEAEEQAAGMRRSAEELRERLRSDQELIEQSLSGLPDELRRVVVTLDSLNQGLRGLTFEEVSWESDPAPGHPVVEVAGKDPVGDTPDEAGWPSHEVADMMPTSEAGIVIDLGEAVSGMDTALARLAGPDVKVCVRASRNVINVWLGPTEAEQLVTSLVNGACEAMGGEGRLEVGVRVDAPPPDRIEALHLPPGPLALLTITDDGPGATRNVGSRRLDQSWTTDPGPESAGPQHITVNELLSRRGGRLHIDYEPLSGTTVSIWLPLVKAASLDPTHQPETPLQGDTSAGRVLVED